MAESHQSPRKPRLAVIGGGISGLAAAHHLHQSHPGADLHVLEAGHRLGGPLHTQHSGDLLLEHGADSFLTKTPWAVDLCREVGIADDLIPTARENRRALVVRAGKLRRVPEGFVLMQARQRTAILKSPVLSIWGKCRLLAEPWIRSPAAVRTLGYDESVASFATRRLGRETFDRLVEPLMGGIYVADADKLSLAATMPEFLVAEQQHGSLWRSLQAESQSSAGDRQASDQRTTSQGPPDAGAGARYGAFLTLRNGLSSLVESIQKSLPLDCIQMNSLVRKLVRTADGRWQIEVDERVAADPYDGVVLATPAPAAARLVERTDPQLAHLLAKIQYASSAVVTLVYGRGDVPHPLDGFGFVVPRIERRSLLAASFPGVKFPDRAPPDRVPIRVFLGGALHPDMLARTDEDLIAIAHREMQDLLGVRGRPQETYIASWSTSMPQYHVGHMQLVDAIESRLGAHHGLELAGNAYRGVGIPQCIRSGREAAERLSRSLTTAARSV